MRGKPWLIASLLLCCLYLRFSEGRESHSVSLNRRGVGLREHNDTASRQPERNSSHGHIPHHVHKERQDKLAGKLESQRQESEKNSSVHSEKPEVLQGQNGLNQTREGSQALQNATLYVTAAPLSNNATESQTAGSQGTNFTKPQLEEPTVAESLEQVSNRDNSTGKELEAEALALAKLEAGRLEAERLAAEGLEAAKLHKQEPGTEEPKGLEEFASSLPQPEAKHVPANLPLRSKKLDIVIAHYYPQRIESMRDFWLWFFNLESVKAWKPYVFVYTQSNDELVINELRPFIIYGGQIVRLENAGRESHVYLQHIHRHYNDLADHTLFAQDEPNTDMLPKKFERMFVEKTGYLPLSFMGHVDCFEEWNDIIPAKVIPQLYGMLTHELCPPSGYAAGFEGQFLVSKRRILRQPLGIYRHLMDMVAAPADHWVHEYHEVENMKDRTNPYMGHALERAWSLAFECFEVWRQFNCYDCEVNKNMEACGGDACQCYDVD